MIFEFLLKRPTAVGAAFLIGSTISCWYILKNYPAVFYKKKPIGKKGFETLIGHRGSRLEGLPENSIAAFKEAAKYTGIIELDVWLTADNQVVVHHDKTLSRMTQGNCNEEVAGINYHELPKLAPPAEQQHQIDAHEYTDCYYVPTLENVLIALATSDVSVIIEFKDSQDELIKQVRGLVGKYKMQDRVFWFSLIDSINNKLKKFDSSIPTITSVEGVLKILVYYHLGILPFLPIDDWVFGITIEELSLEKLRGEKALSGAPDWLIQILARLLEGRPPKFMMCPDLFTHLRARGIPVWFLGVNNTEDLHLAVDAGATAVLTDRVHHLHTYTTTHTNSTGQGTGLSFRSIHP